VTAFSRSIASSGNDFQHRCTGPPIFAHSPIDRNTLSILELS